ncbi:four helix bundle protein [Desulfurivibrio sp. D14AmB]|uniref:four helix bundle protein n=1 Tax=Desulfurivibrio sp. D14AmB TaxID=3374370 RepID=UPI00376EB651
MRHLHHLPIWRDANRLMLELEQAVRGFSRYHKYTVGSELRTTALRICQTIHRAQSRKQGKLNLVQQLAEQVDDLKLQIQLARELKAFENFAQFQRVAELTVSLGKQAGGWLKQTRAVAGRSKASPRDPMHHCAPAPPA